MSLNYRGDFLINHHGKITDKIIVEYSAFDGMVTENILHYEPKHITVTDSNPVLFNINKASKSSNATLMMYDVINDSDSLTKVLPNVDTAISCGYLYHTCHPLWSIERMLLIHPKWFYLETSYPAGERPFLSDEPVGDGMQSLYKGAMPKNLLLPEHIIIEATESLGYKLIDRIVRLPDQELTDDQNGSRDNYAAYFPFWKTKIGLWFERVNDE